MEAMVKIILESSTNGNILWVPILIMLTLVLNVHKIHSYFDSRKRLKLDILNEALKCEFVKEKTKNHLEEEIEAEYFYQVAGV